MLSSGGTEPDTWTWTPSDGSTTRGEVPALPIPSPVDGSGRSRSNGAGRHRDQPPLARNRTMILGGAYAVAPGEADHRHQGGVEGRRLPEVGADLGQPQVGERLLEDPDPGGRVRLEQQPAVSAAVLGVEGAQDPGARPGDDPSTENGDRGGTQHLSASGTRRARVVVKSHFSLTRHTSDHIGCTEPGCTRRASGGVRGSPNRSRGVSPSPYLFDMAADPQREEAPVERPFRALARAPQRAAVRRKGRAERNLRGHPGHAAARPAPPPDRGSRVLRGRAGPDDRIADRATVDLRRPPRRSQRPPALRARQRAGS